MLNNLNPQVLITRVLVLLVALTLHEYAHARVADWLGDDTPRLAGRLTLNPLKHLDPVGTLTLLLAGFGWARPVPVDGQNLRRAHPAGMVFVAIAGPLTNLLLAIIASLPLRLKLVAWVSSPASSLLASPADFLWSAVSINVALFLFNLIPLAPLDGEKLIAFLIPDAWQEAYRFFSQYSPLLLLFLMVIAPRLGFNFSGLILGKPLMWIVSLLTGA